MQEDAMQENKLNRDKSGSSQNATPAPPPPPPAKAQKYLRRVLLCLSSILLSLLLLEGLMQLLPVPSVEILQHDPVTYDQPVAKYAPPHSEYTYSRDWNFSLVNKGWINNAGFLHDQDYDSNGSAPIFAVMGDSFVASIHFPFEETLMKRLSEEAKNAGGNIYSFCMTGAPASQYLIWAKHAQDNYNVQSAIFVFSADDIHDSLLKHGRLARYHQFAEGENGELYLHLAREYKGISPLRTILHKSALYRYLQYNVNLFELWNLIAKKRSTPKLNPDASEGEERVRNMERTVDAFLQMAPTYSGLPPENILFVVDANRGKLFKGLKQTKNRQALEDCLASIRPYFISKAREQGFEMIDMEPIFIEDYQKHGRNFEEPTDWHWNGYGHQVASEAIQKSGVFQRFLLSASNTESESAQEESSSAVEELPDE